MGVRYLNLRGPEQTGDPGTQQKTNDDGCLTRSK